jgi:murein DD-endopeptidase MepM/ murein hydrolase activator NlpD
VGRKLLLIGLWVATLAGVVVLCFRLAGVATLARADDASTKIRNEPEEVQTTADHKDSEPPKDAEYWGLAADGLGLPIAGLRKADVQDTFDQGRDQGGRRHEAVDIMQPRGTPVLAMTAGSVKKLFHSKPGGLTVYQFDVGEAYCFYYAHLDRYADGLEEGMVVNRGDVLGYVGSTGNASPEAPHLHLAVFRLGPEKKWWEGIPVNPYPILQRLIDRESH